LSCMRNYWLSMEINIQLDPEMEHRLAEQAQAQGVSFATYIRQILERQLAHTTIEHKLSGEEFEAALDAMTVYSDKIPTLPLDALTRDEIYRDHD
jgi:predicted DNA-binding protein